jgi:hypothetical protein
MSLKSALGWFAGLGLGLLGVGVARADVGPHFFRPERPLPSFHIVRVEITTSTEVTQPKLVIPRGRLQHAHKVAVLSRPSVLVSLAVALTASLCGFCLLGRRRFGHRFLLGALIVAGLSLGGALGWANPALPPGPRVPAAVPVPPSLLTLPNVVYEVDDGIEVRLVLPRAVAADLARQLKGAGQPRP